MTMKAEFSSARNTFKAAICRIQTTGSPIAYREAMQAQIAMQQAAGHSITEARAYQMVAFQLNKNYHPFGDARRGHGTSAW
jgi:hypothetical protein